MSDPRSSQKTVFTRPFDEVPPRIPFVVFCRYQSCPCQHRLSIEHCVIYLSHKQTRERGVDVLDEFWYGLEQFTLSVNHMSVTFFLYTRVHEVRPSQCSAAGQSFLRDGLLYLSRYQDLPLTFFSPSPPNPNPFLLSLGVKQAGSGVQVSVLTEMIVPALRLNLLLTSLRMLNFFSVFGTVGTVVSSCRSNDCVARLSAEQLLRLRSA